VEDAVGRYVVYLKSVFPKNMDLSGMKIVVDCAHGAAYRVAPSVFEELGANVITIGDEPNGENINEGCGSLYPDVISRVVREHNADAGIALDGDADRVIVVDEKGNEVNGDRIMAICALDKMERRELTNGVLVATVMSNMGLELFMKQIGGSLVRTAVGDRYVLDKMIKGNYSLGGEQSGHLIFLNYSTTGDGVLAALKLLSVMVEKQKPLSELAALMTDFPQVLKNITVREKKDIKKIPSIQDVIKGAEEKLGDRGRILVRFSGTEPKARVMVEGEDEALINRLVEDVAGIIEKELG